MNYFINVIINICYLKIMRFRVLVYKYECFILGVYVIHCEKEKVFY